MVYFACAANHEWVGDRAPKLDQPQDLFIPLGHGTELMVLRGTERAWGSPVLTVPGV
jgi:hypothetical protein